MAFLLFRSGKQMVRSSSSWAAKVKPQLPRALTSVNCFSTDSSSSSSSSSGGMTQKSDPKVEAALEDMLVTGYQYFAKNLVKEIHNKPLPSEAECRKFLDDLFEIPVDSLMKDSTSETDQSEENPKATTPEMIKTASDIADAITGGWCQYLPKPAYKAKGDNFNFTRDTNGLYLTINVPRLKKEQLVVWVVRDELLVSSASDVAPEEKVGEAITLPDDHTYDADKVTGTIMEDGLLKISFPVSNEGGEPKEKYFEVKLV